MRKLRFLVTVLVLALAMSVAVFATDTEARDFTFENDLASDLKALGLFSGVSDTNFDLERVPTRTEVLVMLIRVLGEEQSAKSGEWEHPFTDVPTWADPYVGYAYENGLTKGVSATKFGTDNASAVTYLTFMLRALGYSDAEGDFAWDNPFALAEGLGLLPEVVDTEKFLRADIVTVSYAALSVNLKDSSQILAEKLIEKGALDAAAYGTNYIGTKLTDKENEGKTALTAEEIFAKCSNAVFYIETFDEEGEPYWSGSGFFIDESGIGVTSYYVIEGAASAEITLPASGAKYKVSGIYDTSAKYDWAVFQVEGSSFTALDANPLPVKGASAVYTIGSPEGLQNTVAEGIVSNSRRVLYEDYTYIQTTAPISDGSDGGALVDKYGSVLGIVYESYYDGQNLNFAIPISTIAPADMSSVTPIGEYNWNKVWYTYETDEVIVKKGEVATYEYEYDYSYADYSAYPKLHVVSSDSSVAAAIFEDENIVRVIGNKAGTATVTISDELSDSALTFTVTVEENPDAVFPMVAYEPDMTEVKLWNGATKIVTVDITEFGLSDDPNGTLVANYTVKSTNSKIKVEHAFAELDDIESYPEYTDKTLPYLGISVTGDKDATGEIIISNDKTDDTLVIPVTVGNRYESAYNELVDSIISAEDVKHVTDSEDESKEYYAAESTVSGVAGGLYYYPASGDVVLSIGIAQQQYSMDISFTWTKDELTKYIMGMNIMGINIVCSGDIDKPESINAKIATFKHDNFDCPEALKSELEPSFTYMLVSILCMLDETFLPEVSPGLDMSDFGFVNLDEAYLAMMESYN
ncbi:MAG: serine protease [Clostridia bacterium]|nr:serine protease [Clostridia bacterium]